jgi:hypothetical protein
LAQRHIARDGWSRTSFPKTETEPWAWLADFLGNPHCLPAIPKPTARKPMAPSQVDEGPRGAVAISPHENP